MAAIQNIEFLPKSSFFSELPCVYHQLLSAEELAGIKTWDLGDIVGVTGTLQRSGKGDLFVDMNGVELLTKPLRPLPEKHKGLTDTQAALSSALCGFERVFEINRNFRNESLPTRRNLEFTMIEFYQAYADYNDMMDPYGFLLLI